MNRSLCVSHVSLCEVFLTPSPFRTDPDISRLKDESQRPQEMRYRCIMAGFDPDTPEEMQEFIRFSTMCLDSNYENQKHPIDQARGKSRGLP